MQHRRHEIVRFAATKRHSFVVFFNRETEPLARVTPIPGTRAWILGYPRYSRMHATGKVHMLLFRGEAASREELCTSPPESMFWVNRKSATR